MKPGPPFQLIVAAAAVLGALLGEYGPLLSAQTQGSRPRPAGALIDGRAVGRDGRPVPGASATAPVYRVQPPDGLLPWPHHDPDFTQIEYDQMMSGLLVLNNFALYQGGDTRDSVYFHSGLDVVLPNGTPMYSIARGTVRAIIGGAPYYLSLVVEDEEAPGWAWIYTHVTPGPRIGPGTRVEKGAQIAVVSFQGVEHVHLVRSFLTPDGSWTDSWSHNDIDPTASFAFEDRDAPVIETPFRYFLNESGKMLPYGPMTLVSGQIDVVAGIRDVGKYAKGRLPGSPANFLYGDRLAPKRIIVSIASASDPQRAIWSQVAWEQENIILRWRPGYALRDQPRVEAVFAFRPEISPGGNGDATLSYYFLTNRGMGDGPRYIDPSDSTPSWDTTASDAAGRPLFPDGEYVITVTASDWKGNTATARDRVVVLNRR